MAVITLVANQQNHEERTNFSILFNSLNDEYFLSKILNDSNNVIFECNSINFEIVQNGIINFLEHHFSYFEIIGEVTLDEDAQILLNRLRNLNN